MASPDAFRRRARSVTPPLRTSNTPTPPTPSPPLPSLASVVDLALLKGLDRHHLAQLNEELVSTMRDPGGMGVRGNYRHMLAHRITKRRERVAALGRERSAAAKACMERVEDARWHATGYTFAQEIAIQRATVTILKHKLATLWDPDAHTKDLLTVSAEELEDGRAMRLAKAVLTPALFVGGALASVAKPVARPLAGAVSSLSARLLRSVTCPGHER